MRLEFAAQIQPTVTAAVTCRFVKRAPERRKSRYGQQQASLRYNQPSRLCEKADWIHVLEHVERHREIELAIRQRNVADIGLHQYRVQSMPPCLSQGLGVGIDPNNISESLSEHG